MLSLQDLLLNPSSVQPLGTKKGVMNKPTELSIDIVDLFLSSSNVSPMVANLHSIYRSNGGKVSFSRFKELAVLLMKKFAKENDLYSYSTAEDDTMEIYNYPMILRTINADFIKFAHKYFKWDYYNPFVDDVEVGPTGARELKKSFELTPDDHLTLEVWREQFTQALGRNFRNNNNIPVHRISMHTRNYDRSNEGFKYDNSDRASLETPVHGYNMIEIYKNLDRYRSEDWYSM